ncbi:NAD-dependent epimerase/dehydratase family protein [Ramlibacter sp. MMS24-I3-19]|uniref:NAD-dependent epimerase/dehydratase family protein n=1 Tax=Ramlibacter sp. MMS24-I3-19 TaxID=3416606 RepID=UPI003D03D5BB
MSRDGVLLLGGAGFIGSALASRLARDDVPVHVVGRHEVDRLVTVLPLCHTVIHLASATTPGSSATRPNLELDNLALTLRLLESLKEFPDIHLIYFSSGGTVYGNPDRLPVTEDSPIAPLSNHGAGKAAQEAFCRALRDQGHAVTILRPSNAYGPGQALRHGFGLVRAMLEHARHGTTLEIWGDGENVRDFIYIDDIVEATTRLIGQPKDSETYNLGAATGYSINEVRRLVETASGMQVRTTPRPARKIDVRGVVLDTSRIRARLDWQPAVDLPEGLERTWKWLHRT